MKFCGKFHHLFSLFFLFLKCVTALAAGDTACSNPSQGPSCMGFARRSYCLEPFREWTLGPLILEYAPQINLDPLLLTIGISSEGLTKGKSKKFNGIVEHNTIEVASNPNVGDSPFILWGCVGFKWLDGEGQLLTPKKCKEVSFGHDEDLVEYYPEYYPGVSIEQDGSDTFGIEWLMLKNKFPTLATNIKVQYFDSDEWLRPTHAVANSEMPDVLIRKFSDLNEPASLRFSIDSTYNVTHFSAKTSDFSVPTSRKPYLQRNITVSVDDSLVGDPGTPLFKNAKAQVIANAMMWKDAIDKFVDALTELKNQKSSFTAQVNRILGPSGQFKDSFSKIEQAFWAKAFFNGGQGTQAAAFSMLKRFLEQNALLKNDYLKANPLHGVTYPSIYCNARIVADSYVYALKNREKCGSGLIQ